MTQEDIYKNGGRGLLDVYYNGSPSAALLSIYPEHNWKLERFQKKHRGFWSNKETNKQFFDRLMNSPRD